MKKYWLWQERLGLLCFLLFLISLAVTLTINFRPLYVLDATRYGLADVAGVSLDTLLKNYDVLMRYLNDPFVKELTMPDFPSSVSGAFHFYEVKRLFLLAYGILAATVIPSIFYLRHLKKTKRFWTFKQPFFLAAAVPVLIGFLMALGFDRFFIAFHELFFNNDDWLFDPRTDPIINVLPEQYFMHCFILFFVLIELFFLGCYLLGRRSLKRL